MGPGELHLLLHQTGHSQKDAALRVRPVAAAGDEQFARAGGAERGELALPERLSADGQRGFVAAHARGAASGEEDGGEGIADCGLRIAD